MEKMFNRVLGGFMLVLLLTQCKKVTVSEEISLSDSKTELAHLKKEALTEILTAGKKQEFKDFILTEALKQRHGDYNVYLSIIISNFKEKKGYEKLISSIESFISKSKLSGNKKEFLIFYPRAETIENSFKLQKSTTKAARTEVIEELVAVFQEEINPDYSSPGYIVSVNNELVFYRDITEDYAWENDVWVFGQEEDVSPENMTAAPEDTIGARFEGQSERGGIIQVTDLGAIEPWVMGKLEFKMTVLSSTGVIISGPRKFGKWKRSNFRDNKWKDFGHFIGNWNTVTFGNWMYEHWMEEDGGKSNETTITMPPPQGQTGPTITTKIPSEDLDDDLGKCTIQFTDDINQVYNISYANIKRKN